MQGDLYSGRYSTDEVQRILQIGARSDSMKKPDEAFYRKSATELEPTWAEKREFVHWLINDSNISQASKRYLVENDHWVQKYQLRGLKYGMFATTATYLFFPVVRKQPFVRRMGLSLLPMAYFLNWGYQWGHENWWRRAKEVMVTYEIHTGTRSKYT